MLLSMVQNNKAASTSTDNTQQPPCREPPRPSEKEPCLILDNTRSATKRHRNSTHVCTSARPTGSITAPPATPLTHSVPAMTSRDHSNQTRSSGCAHNRSCDKPLPPPPAPQHPLPDCVPSSCTRTTAMTCEKDVVAVATANLSNKHVAQHIPMQKSPLIHCQPRHPRTRYSAVADVDKVTAPAPRKAKRRLKNGSTNRHQKPLVRDSNRHTNQVNHPENKEVALVQPPSPCQMASQAHMFEKKFTLTHAMAVVCVNPVRDGDEAYHTAPSRSCMHEGEGSLSVNQQEITSFSPGQPMLASMRSMKTWTPPQLTLGMGLPASVSASSSSLSSSLRNARHTPAKQDRRVNSLCTSMESRRTPTCHRTTNLASSKELSRLHNGIASSSVTHRCRRSTSELICSHSSHSTPAHQSLRHHSRGHAAPSGQEGDGTDSRPCASTTPHVSRIASTQARNGWTTAEHRPPASSRCARSYSYSACRDRSCSVSICNSHSYLSQDENSSKNNGRSSSSSSGRSSTVSTCEVNACHYVSSRCHNPSSSSSTTSYSFTSSSSSSSSSLSSFTKSSCSSSSLSNASPAERQKRPMYLGCPNERNQFIAQNFSQLAAGQINPALFAEYAVIHEWDGETGSWKRAETRVVVNPEPFAQGNMRVCYQIIDMQRLNCQLVAKRYIREDVKKHQYYEDVAMYMLAAHWARLYNTLQPPKKVKYVPAAVIELPHRLHRQQPVVLALEPLLTGAFCKHNNNYGFVARKSRWTPQTFSHFTYSASKKELLITDIQGVEDIYTDPQILTRDGVGYGRGNLGQRGIRRFIRSHRCNPVCRALGLPSLHTSEEEVDSGAEPSVAVQVAKDAARTGAKEKDLLTATSTSIQPSTNYFFSALRAPEYTSLIQHTLLPTKTFCEDSVGTHSDHPMSTSMLREGANYTKSADEGGHTNNGTVDILAQSDAATTTITQSHTAAQTPRLQHTPCHSLALTSIPNQAKSSLFPSCDSLTDVEAVVHAMRAYVCPTHHTDDSGQTGLRERLPALHTIHVEPPTSIPFLPLPPTHPLPPSYSCAKHTKQPQAPQAPQHGQSCQQPTWMHLPSAPICANTQPVLHHTAPYSSLAAMNVLHSALPVAHLYPRTTTLTSLNVANQHIARAPVVHDMNSNTIAAAAATTAKINLVEQRKKTHSNVNVGARINSANRSVNDKIISGYFEPQPTL